MEIIIGIIVIFIIYWIFQKVRHSRGIIGAMIYNEDFGLKPYGKYDMELANNIRSLGGKIYMSEIIIFKWYLLRSVFGVLGTNDIYKMKSIELNQQLDKAFFNGFGTELKKFTQEDLEIRLRHFYLSNIPMYIDKDKLENMSDDDVYNTIFQDNDVIENIGYLFLNGSMSYGGYNNPIFIMHISKYIRRSLYMQRILLKNILLNPQMLTI